MAPSRPDSRFAFILHADVIGSTALVQRDEGLAHQRIHDAFRRLDACISRHGGATHEIRGDAIVAEFEKASDALTAALDFQRGSGAGRRSDGEDALRLRIGIAMGEVIVADGTVTGAGVVLAQRLEQLANGDGVVIQGAACESIPQRMPFEFDPLGEQEVKGFERPVRAFRARLADGATLPSPTRSRPVAGLGGRRWRGIAAAVLATTAVLAALAWWQPWRPAQSIPPSASLSHPLPDNPSVAVLPFVDTRQAQTDAYLADGLAEQLIASLAQVPGLFVIARDSVFTYKGVPVEATRVSQELGVRYVVEVEFTRGERAITLAYRIVDGLSGRAVTASRVERPASRLFDLQDTLLREVLSSLPLATAANHPDPVGDYGTDDLEAYDYYLRGQAFYHLASAEDNERARQMFRRALEIDPDFARAYAQLAMTYVNDLRFGWNNAGEASLAQARESAETAVELDHESAQAHRAAGHVSILGGDPEAATAAGERAIELSPGLADAYVVVGTGRTLAGDADAGVELIQQAIRMNPYAPLAYSLGLGRARFFAGDFREARLQLERAIELNPNMVTPHVLLAATLGRLGEQEEAARRAQQVLTLDPGFTMEGWLARERITDEAYADSLAQGLKIAGLVTEKPKERSWLRLPGLKLPDLEPRQAPDHNSDRR